MAVNLLPILLIEITVVSVIGLIVSKVNLNKSYVQPYQAPQQQKPSNQKQLNTLQENYDDLKSIIDSKLEALNNNNEEEITNKLSETVEDLETDLNNKIIEINKLKESVKNLQDQMLSNNTDAEFKLLKDSEEVLKLRITKLEEELTNFKKNYVIEKNLIDSKFSLSENNMLPTVIATPVYINTIPSAPPAPPSFIDNDLSITTEKIIDTPFTLTQEKSLEPQITPEHLLAPQLTQEDSIESPLIQTNSLEPPLILEKLLEQPSTDLGITEKDQTVNNDETVNDEETVEDIENKRKEQEIEKDLKEKADAAALVAANVAADADIASKAMSDAVEATRLAEEEAAENEKRAKDAIAEQIEIDKLLEETNKKAIEVAQAIEKAEKDAVVAAEEAKNIKDKAEQEAKDANDALLALKEEEESNKKIIQTQQQEDEERQKIQEAEQQAKDAEEKKIAAQQAEENVLRLAEENRQQLLQRDMEIKQEELRLQEEAVAKAKAVEAENLAAQQAKDAAQAALLTQELAEAEQTRKQQEVATALKNANETTRQQEIAQAEKEKSIITSSNINPKYAKNKILEVLNSVLSDLTSGKETQLKENNITDTLDIQNIIEENKLNNLIKINYEYNFDLAKSDKFGPLIPFIALTTDFYKSYEKLKEFYSPYKLIIKNSDCTIIDFTNNTKQTKIKASEIFLLVLRVNITVYEANQLGRNEIKKNVDEKFTFDNTIYLPNQQFENSDVFKNNNNLYKISNHINNIINNELLQIDNDTNPQSGGYTTETNYLLENNYELKPEFIDTYTGGNDIDIDTYSNETKDINYAKTTVVKPPLDKKLLLFSPIILLILLKAIRIYIYTKYSNINKAIIIDLMICFGSVLILSFIVNSNVLEFLLYDIFISFLLISLINLIFIQKNKDMDIKTRNKYKIIIIILLLIPYILVC